MGETVDALGYKADVKSRAKDSIAETKEKVVGSVTNVKDRVVGSIAGTTSSARDSVTGMASGAGDALPDGAQVHDGARRAAGVAQQNPLGLAIGAVAAGFIAGMLVPSTRVEDDRIGPLADQLKEKGQEALQSGAGKVQEAAQSALGSAAVDATQNLAAKTEETFFSSQS
jgi:hypothetical protein